MKKYIGVKVIEAEFIPDARQLEEDGPRYSINKQDGYAILGPGGYQSWSPKAQFEEAYRPVEVMSCGMAIELMKKGYKGSRLQWGEKFVYYVAGGTYPTQMPVAKQEFGAKAIYNPYLAMRQADGSVSMWTPNMEDMLTEDWQIVD